MTILDRAPAATRTATRPGTPVAVDDLATAQAHATTAPAVRPSGSTPQLSCPDCAQPAWVEWRDEVNSTSGPVVHVKVRCLDRHWFLMPEGWLTTTPA